MKRIWTTRAAFLLAAWSALPASACAAEFTPFISGIVGGSFHDETTGADLEIKPSAAGGFIVSFPWESNSQLEFYVSRQPTEVRPETGPGPRFDLNVNYYHVGGTVLLEPHRNLQPYFAATAGATHFDPGGDLDSEFRFSFSAGLGIKYPVSERLALRLEGRGFATFMESDSTVFCNLPGTCKINVSGSTLFQWQALLGLAFRF